MKSHLTVRDVLPREFVGVSEGDSVSASARLLLDEDANHLVVLRGSDPVGIVSLHDLLRMFLDGEADNATVADAMTTEFETIPPNVSVTTAADRFAGSPRPLLVMNGEEFEGVLTERDLLTVPHDQLYDEDVIVDDGGVDVDESVPTTEADQGICEACGAFTRTLTVVDGRTLCADCRDV